MTCMMSDLASGCLPTASVALPAAKPCQIAGPIPAVIAIPIPIAEQPNTNASLEMFIKISFQMSYSSGKV